MVTPDKWLQKEELAFAEFFSNPATAIKSLDYAVSYCDRYDSLLRDIWSRLVPATKGAVLCAFGSPARYEMLGESDLDCIIIRENDVDITDQRNKLIKILNSYGFSKIDIPEWGSLSDCRNFLKSAITEGNQVIEARFIQGDRQTWENVGQLNDQYCTRDRFRVTFAFQHFYFEQYYKQRERENQNNLKYGHGGTRDFLFPVWLANFREGHKFMQGSKEPSIIKGLKSLLGRGNITDDQFEQMKNAANTIALMRNELLRQSIGTNDSGLTYLGDVTAQKLADSQPQIYTNKDDVLKDGLKAIKTIKTLKDICFATFMNEEDVKERIGPGVELDPSEELSATVLSWKSNLSQADNKTLRTLGDSASWSVLTSLACNPTCPQKLLQNLAEKGTQRGYEYVAKVVGRNPNTTTDTLIYIAGSRIEERFREPARVRLAKGWKRANESQ